MPLPVHIGLMTGGEIRYETATSLCAAIAQQAISEVTFTHSGPYLDAGRNNVVKTFCDPRIRERCTHLLMLDSDIMFNVSDVELLYEASCEPGRERAVVGGVYYNNFDGRPGPVVYDWGTNALGQKILEPIKEWDDGYPSWPDSTDPGDLSPLTRVEGIGAGFLMIRYEVIDVLYQVFGEPQPWFSEPVVDGIHFGEDLAFCQRVKDSGFSVWAHRGVKLRHVKPVQIGP